MRDGKGKEGEEGKGRGEKGRERRGGEGDGWPPLFKFQNTPLVEPISSRKYTALGHYTQRECEIQEGYENCAISAID